MWEKRTSVLRSEDHVLSQTSIYYTTSQDIHEQVMDTDDCSSQVTVMPINIKHWYGMAPPMQSRRHPPIPYQLVDLLLFS
jgi:hypothetical protein